MSALMGNFNYPTRVWVGAGRAAELGAACALAGIKAPLIVTDRVLAGLPLIGVITDALEAAELPYTIFADVQGNPTEHNVDAGLTALRAGAHDGIVALGGGSAVDVGKVLAFMAGQRRPLWDFEDVADHWIRADAAAILPVVALPTTAGTGSEVGRAGVITQASTHTKKVIFHPGMMPKVAICDPELTLGLPPSATAATGLDAFVHCLEAYCAPGYHPLADGIAIEGMRLVQQYLPRAYANGADLEARTQMMVAAAMGATAFQKGLGAIHALAHPVGALYDTHHGLTNAVIMPYVLRYNRPAIEDKIDRLGRWLGLDAGFEAFMRFILELRARLSIPHRLGDMGVGKERAAQVAAMAVVDPTASGNPRPLDEATAQRLFEAAVDGRLESRS